MTEPLKMSRMSPVRLLYFRKGSRLKGGQTIFTNKKASTAVLVVYEASIFPSRSTKTLYYLQRLHDELPDVRPRALVIVDSIAHVAVLPPEQVEHWQELSTGSTMSHQQGKAGQGRHQII